MQTRDKNEKTIEKLNTQLILGLGMVAINAYFAYIAYQFFTGQIKIPGVDFSDGQINIQKLDFSNEDFKDIPFLYDWFPLDLPKNEEYNLPIPMLFHVLRNIFPIKSTALTQIGVGVLANFLTLPLKILAGNLGKKMHPDTFVELQHVITPAQPHEEFIQTSKFATTSKPSIPLPKGIHKEIQTNPGFLFQTKYNNPVEEELIFRGSLPLLAYNALYNSGFSANKALMASTLISNTLFSLAHEKGWRFHAFVSGLLCSGLTILHKGSIWGAIAAHMTNNIIAVNNISSFIKDTPVDTIMPFRIKQDEAVTNSFFANNSTNPHRFFDTLQISKKIKHKNKHKSKPGRLNDIEVSDEEMAHSVFAHRTQNH